MNIVYSKSRIPPSEGRGVVIASIKDIFVLVDEYPSREKGFEVDWVSYWMRHDWCWISERVRKELRDYSDVAPSFKKWRGNLAEVERKKSKSFYDKKRQFKDYQYKKAKLLGTYPEDFSRWMDFKVMGLFEKPILLEAYASKSLFEGGELDQKEIQKLLRILKSKNLSNIPSPRRITARIHLLQENKNWVANYEKGVLEINMTALRKLPLVKQAYQFLLGLGLAYLPLMFRSKMKLWFRYFKRKPVPVRSKYLPPQLSRPHKAFAIGVADMAFGENTTQAYAVKEYFGLIAGEATSLDLVEDVNDIEGITPSMLDSLEDVADTVVREFPYLANPMTREGIASLLGLSEVGELGFLDQFDQYGDEAIVGLTTDFGGETSLVIETEGADGDQSWNTTGDEDDGFNTARTITRTQDGTLTLYNDVFKLPENYQGGGSGVKMIGKQIGWCLENGVSSITCHAARLDGEFIGYKVWHKMGYDATLNVSQFKSEFRDQYLDFVLLSHTNTIQNSLIEDLYEWFSNLLSEMASTRSTFLTRFVPNAWLFDVDDRYMEIAYEGRENDFSDIVEKMSRDDFTLFLTNLRNYRTPQKVEKFYESATEFHPYAETIQNLMDIHGFEEFWAGAGYGWKAKLDLSDGTESDAFLIFSLYQQKKGLGKMASSGFANTKAMGELSLSELELFDQARKELRAQKKQAKRLASKWLA